MTAADHRLPTTLARLAAQRFVADIASHDRQWTVATAAGYLPAGWYLSADCCDEDLHPVTIANVARVLRLYARLVGR